MPQLSQSGRIVSLIAVSQGLPFLAQPGDTSWTSVSNGTGDDPPLIFDGQVFMAPNNQKMYFADGVNWVRYDPLTNTAERWSASYGALPVDSQNNTPRLICTWRGRTVLSGLILDPQAVFMSRVDDATDFDYFPVADRQSPAQAVALTLAPQGQVGDIVTCLIPYTDDVLLIGCSDSIYQLTGDPMANGQLALVTKAIGMAWGQPYCMDPYGTIYFVSSKLGIFTMRPGQLPVRISQPIEQLVQAVNTGDNVVCAVWDDRYQLARFFFTPAAAPGATTHLVFEARTQSWWQVAHANTLHDPICCAVLDGNRPEDRVACIGSWDGYVRFYDADADDDDGTPIASSVVIGPVTTKNLDDVLLKDLQAVLGEDSGAVTYSVYVGSTAEEALGTTPVDTGTWEAGRNLTDHVRYAGHAVYVKLSSTSRWAMEQIRGRMVLTGKVRRRGY